MTTITSYLAGAGAFILTLAVVSGVIGSGLAFPAACVAGYFAWKYFYDKYKLELNALLNPPAEVWALSMPNAWTALKDALNNAYMETGVTGISNWRIQSEDNTRGTLQAQINFQQMLGAGANARNFQRSVTMTVLMLPEEAGTKIEIHYQIYSPSGTGMVEDLVRKTQATINHRVLSLGNSSPS